MSRFRLADLPLIVKIGFAPVLALLMLAILAVVSVIAQMQSANDLRTAVDVRMANSLQIQRISERITDAHGRLYMLLTHQAGKIDTDKIEKQTKTLVDDLAQIQKDIKAIETAAPEAQKPKFAKLRKQVEETRSAADLVGSMMTADFSAAASFIAPFEQSYVQMVATLADVVKDTQQTTSASAAESEARAALTELLLGVGALITLLIVAVVAWLAMMATKKDIQTIADATERLAGGDNEIDLEALTRKDELGAIIRSLTVFRDNQLRMIQMRKENEAQQEARAKEVAGVIASLGTALEHLGNCDLSYRLKDEFPKEYLLLRDGFNKTIEELENTLAVIMRVTSDIQAATSSEVEQEQNKNVARDVSLKAIGAALVEALESFRENERHMILLREETQAAQEAKAKEVADVVEKLGKGIDHLAAGDLTYKLSDDFPVEYHRLRDDFNAALEKLEETLGTIREVTDVIRTGSGDVSTAVDDLSKRTEHQAATLEETAAALDEITATVKNTADGADNVRTTIATAKDEALGSGHVVKDAVNAMHEIKTSADQISQIVGAIDEITFQTNLLSLNASVEAARAGEAGKGFAVVATEVRELSHRTAKMAKEIKNLITASGLKVRQGVSLVEETGKTLDRIVSQIVGVSDVVNQIAASAKEQSTGLEQINTAVNDMDTVTQQNSAMVQETTVASQSLAKQAEELVQLLNRFKVEERQSAVRTASAPRVMPKPTVVVHPAANKPKPTSVVTPHKNIGSLVASAHNAPAGDNWEEF